MGAQVATSSWGLSCLASSPLPEVFLDMVVTSMVVSAGLASTSGVIAPFLTSRPEATGWLSSGGSPSHDELLSGLVPKIHSGPCLKLWALDVLRLGGLSIVPVDVLGLRHRPREAWLR